MNIPRTYRKQVFLGMWLFHTQVVCERSSFWQTFAVLFKKPTVFRKADKLLHERFQPNLCMELDGLLNKLRQEEENNKRNQGNAY